MIRNSEAGRPYRAVLGSIFLCTFIFMGFPALVQGITIPASSPAQVDVNAAIAAASAGDTVLIPAGTAVWSANLTITKGITLIGAGIGNTVITCNYTGSSDRLSAAGYLIAYVPASPASDDAFRISGLTINLSGICRGIILINKTINVLNRIRIDHTQITGGESPFSIWGTVYGVADSNVWYGCYISIDGLDDLTWNNFRFDFGTADNFYFEDNNFIGTIVDVGAGNRSEMGARWCFRYNTIDNTGITGGVYPVLDMHGNIPNAHLSTMGAEVYNNLLTESGDGLCILDQRGGKALVYNNSIVTTGSVFTKVREEYLDSLNPPAFAPLSGQPQHVSESYYWSNKYNGVTMTSDDPYIDGTVNYGGTIGLVPMEDRDFWREKGPFNGTTGVGAGPIANRPATCTTGVGYWATDQGVLYRATAANTWTAYYTPYTYPHPLRSSGGTSPLTVTALNPSPAPPQGTGTTITWTALTSGGTLPLQYRFYLYSAATNAWTMVRDYTTTGTWSWTPTAVGQYAVQVWVRNAGSTTTYDAMKSSPTFSITAPSTLPTVKSLTASPTVPRPAGTTITWTATATGGTAPLQYQYWLYSGVTASWTMVRDYSTSASWAWTPTQAAQYAVQVWVRNAGSTTKYDAWLGSGYFNITAASGPPTVTSLKATPAPPQSAGTTITWTAAATGGIAPLQYQYWLYSGVTASWTMVRDYSTSASWSWTPTQAAQYAIQVWVRNAGSTAKYDAWLGSGYFTIR